MTRRGEITVECDSETCHAELVVPACALHNPTATLASLRIKAGWRAVDGKDICPDCIEEGKGTHATHRIGSAV